MKRGILYYIWGTYKKDQLHRSIKSAEKFGYEYEVITAKSKLDGFRKREHLFDSTPFDTTLYLDIDTEIRNTLEFGFDMAEKYKLACAIAPVSECYDCREAKSIKHLTPRDMPQYNCGVLFFTKETEPIFRRWEELLREHPDSARNDQPYFSLSVYEHDINPYVLPKNWNYRPHVRYEHYVYAGSIKILHSHMTNIK